jgi:hypothetical protein
LPSINSIPFGKPEPTDDVLFPPIRSPTDETVPVPQINDNGQDGKDDDTDAEAEAMTEDGSEAADESDEVSSPCPAHMSLFF